MLHGGTGRAESLFVQINKIAEEDSQRLLDFYYYYILLLLLHTIIIIIVIIKRRRWAGWIADPIGLS